MLAKLTIFLESSNEMSVKLVMFKLSLTCFNP